MLDASGSRVQESYIQMNEYEIGKLKKELQRKQEQLKEEKEDHQHTQQQLVQIQAERDRFYSELVINRQTIEKVQALMAQKMKEIKLKLEQENSDSLTQLQALRDKLAEEQNLRQRLIQEGRNKDSVISELSLRLKEMSRKYKDPSLLVNVKQVGEQVAVTNQNFYKLTEKYNKACADIENLLAENKILRKLHGVPDNFGFDLEEIKVAEKQELEDYKAQCRKLQTEIEELEEERTQLRYRLRQFNTLFSNKGERYKDMTNQQLDFLDQYALNLKEGRVELPSIDKTQKQMEREIIKLRGQIQILQNKQAPTPKISVQNSQDQTERLSVQALKRLEDQISKMINPIREDVKKITENGIKVPEAMWEQGNRASAVNINLEGPQFKPPMPLPIAHNDWSQIKEGFSYLSASKIPIDLKDVSDQAGFNLAKAKYEVAALQLQNMESLKLLRQKEGVQAKLGKELAELKDKYEKCLRVQDQLFMSYFKEKEQSDEKSRKAQIEKNNLLSEKQQAEVSLNIINQSFNSLSKKTEVEKRCGELTSRLAIAEAQLLKSNRKYEVLEQQHKMLRSAYSKLQSKSAASEYSLKEKLTFAKRNQKQLCFLLNKTIEQSRDSVPGEVHKTTLTKLQCLNDQRVSSAVKQTELRIKINQLENIEREVTLKEDIIQTLREDNFDINLELQIVKNRLQATDSDYRTFQNVFRRLVGFINHHNVSVLTYFKKFDKDNSGELTKSEFISAIRALGFEVTNNEFELLFNQFDLDGSQSITYREFLRKMRRSGVFTRNAEQQALYRLFKAIKQANITVRKAFQMIDMDGSNQVSKTEMENAFRKIGIDITPSTLDYIFKMCDTDGSGTISSNQFQKLFDDIIRESAIEEKEVFGTQLDWKLTFVLKMAEVSEKYYQGGLKQTFKSLDRDGNASLTLNELTDFFTKAGIDLPKKQLLELFNFLDRHRDGKVQYFQFLKVLEEAQQEKKRVDRMKYIRVRVQELRKQSQGEGRESERRPVAEDKALQIKLLSLQSKHASLLKKNDKLIKTLATREQEVTELKKQVDQLEKNVQKIRAEYYKEKQNSIKNQEQLNSRISEADSKKITDQVRKAKLQLEELKNEVEVYKKLYADLSTKNRYDEMRVVKIESEVEKSYQLVKDLQSLSDPNAELGKKIYELQISKRNEEVVNKKYDQIVEEARQTQQEMLRMSEEVMEKEREIINVHFFFQEKHNLLQHTIDQLHSQILPTLNPSKVQDILLKIRDISTAKSQLEKENREIRDLLFNLQVRNDYLQNQKQATDELQKKLKRTYTDESSLTIIDLTKKLSEFRMSELRAKRQASLLKEKEEYYLRVNNAHSENLKEIEAELANWETKYNEREEFWRKRLAEQMKLMEDLQKETSKTKQEQRNAEAFFKEQRLQEEAIEEKYEALPQSKQDKISSFIKRSQPSSDNIVFELKAKIQELENELVEKEKEIYQWKTSFKEIVPEAKLSDFGGQMSASTTNFLMQTELTTSQLRNNARRFINNQKDQENYYKEEATKISQAAQQSIDTLQRMIDDKNQQLKRKDHLIESLRREFLAVKEEDTRQINFLNEEIRELKTKAQTSSVNQIMNRPTSRNFFGGQSQEVLQIRKQLARKEQEIAILQDKYDQLYISKQKKGQEQTSASQRVLERKIEELNIEREAEKKAFQENLERLNQKIKKLEKLSKEKDLKLSKLQKTIGDLKNQAVNEVLKGESTETENQLRQAILSMTKGKTANDSKMQITMQRALQAMQELSKKNKQYEAQVKRLREDKFGRTAFKK